jgi:hypothetical protein
MNCGAKYLAAKFIWRFLAVSPPVYATVLKLPSRREPLHGKTVHATKIKVKMYKYGHIQTEQPV